MRSKSHFQPILHSWAQDHISNWLFNFSTCMFKLNTLDTGFIVLVTHLHPIPYVLYLTEMENSVVYIRFLGVVLGSFSSPVPHSQSATKFCQLDLLNTSQNHAVPSNPTIISCAIHYQFSLWFGIHVLTVLFILSFLPLMCSPHCSQNSALKPKIYHDGLFDGSALLLRWSPTFLTFLYDLFGDWPSVSQTSLVITLIAW